MMKPAAGAERPPLAGGLRFGLAALFLLSGFAGLVYQVLWLRDLGLVFGNASQAAATTLAAFFLGLAAGGGYWGRRAPSLADPLRAYAWLEVGIAATGLLFLALVPLYRGLYGPLYAWVGQDPALFSSARVLMALVVLLPPAFLMGGTFPVVGEARIRSPGELGRIGTFLYGINTAGAALGALAAGFFLPRWLGYRGAYLTAVGLSLVVGAAAFLLARSAGVAGRAHARSAADAREEDQTRTRGRAAGRPGSRGRVVLAIAFGSGVATLALEVLWTRMFSQVLQNSVYSYAAILVVFLVALAAGSAVANRLTRWRGPSPHVVLAGLLATGAVAAAAVPWLFQLATGRMGYVGSGEGWAGYVVSIFAAVTAVLLVPGALVGAVFPYLLKVREGEEVGVGRAIGELVAANTLGGATGALLAGFVLLPWAGLWGSTLVVALAYGGLALLAAAAAAPRARRSALGAALLAIVACATVVNPARLPAVRLDSDEGERLVEVREGDHGVVAVVERPEGLRIKVNNFYSLGGTASADHERNQALLPLMVHPSPERVFFLGMGTGITAGAALFQPAVEHVTVTELIPEVVQASAAHFGPWTGGLFDDPRATVLAVDGRNHLAATDAHFDLVIGDLFIPWKAGVAELYTLEHFRTARDRLTPGGAFVQWLPLYQLTRSDFDVIARTFLEAFPRVQLWRGDFFAEKPIVALVGSEGLPPLDPRVVAARGRALGGGATRPDLVFEAVTLPFYAGNLGEARHLVPDGPLNTDDDPVLGFRAPVSHRRARTGAEGWFVGEALIDFLERLREAVPSDADPYLVHLDEEQRRMVDAGLLYHAGNVAARTGRPTRASELFAAYLETMPVDFRPETDGDEAYSSFGG